MCVLQARRKTAVCGGKGAATAERGAKDKENVKIRSDVAENAPYTSQPSSLFVADGRKMLLICRKDVTNLSQGCY